MTNGRDEDRRAGGNQAWSGGQEVTRRGYSADTGGKVQSARTRTQQIKLKLDTRCE